MAGLFQRLDTHMVDSHLMLSAMKLTSKIRRNYPAKWARDAANDPEYLGTLWRVGQKAVFERGGAKKRRREEHPQTPRRYLYRGKRLRVAAAASSPACGAAHRRAAVPAA